MKTQRVLLVFSGSLFSAALVACGSGGSGTATPSPRPDRVVTDLGISTGGGTGTRSGNLSFYTDEGYESIEVASASADFLWPSLLAAYEDLEIPLGMIDTEAHIVGNPEARLPRRFAGLRMSRLFRCGTTMTGPVADASVVTVNIETRIDEVEGGSVVSTLVRATAIPTDGSGAQRPCTSTGRMEQEVHETLLKRLVTG